MRLTRPAAALSAAALLLSPVVAQAVTPSATGAPTAAAAALPTSWPAVPVGERLQPWLAQELAKGGTGPLRVMVSGETIQAATDAAKASGMTIQQTWTSSGIVVAIGSPAQVRDVVTQPGVRAVEGDQPITFQLDTAHKATRSDVAETAFKASDGTSRLGGAGSSVAIIDSGIDGRHPFFQRDGKSTVVRNLKNVCTVLSGPTDTCFQHDPSNDTDTTSVGGHGTHVAGITGGVDTILSDGTEVRGSAPDVNLVGLSVGATLSIINANAAMQWVLEHHRRPCRAANDQSGPIDETCPPIKATNHSYGPASVPAGGHTFRANDPAVTIQRNLVLAGVTVVWAAGNSAGDGSIATTNPPAMDSTPGVLMVASYNDGGTGDRDNQLSTFSSRGAKTKPETFPDLSAPGDLITSACRPYLAVCSTGFDFRNGPGLADIGTFNTISGTSMATPYVAGVVAQLVQARPDITPAEVEDLLEDNAYAFGTGYVTDALNSDNRGTSFDKGHGLVDVAATLASLLQAAAPGDPAPACTNSSFQVLDRGGDATQVVLVDTPLPTQPSLDITKAFLTYDGTALTFAIDVTDLKAGPPVGSVGEFFRFYVTRTGDPEVFVTAARNATTGDRFSLRQQGGLTTPLQGAFDTAKSQVRVTLPLADYSKVLVGKTLAVGDTFTVGQLLGQRDTNAATLTADTATGSCPFVIGTSTPGVEAAPAPGGGDTGGDTGGVGASASPTPTATEPTPTSEPTSPADETSSPSPAPTTASPSPSPTKKGGGKPSPTCSPKGKGGSCK